MTALTIQLEQLENAQLVRRTLDEDLSYLFKHALTQEAAYESLLVKKRREIHRRVAQAFERTYPNQLDEYAAVLAAHYAQAGDDARTALYATRAGDLAAHISAYTEARAHYSSALAALAHLPDSEQNRRARVEASLKQINVAWGIDSAEQNLSLLFQAETLARTLPASDRSILARVLSWIGRVYSYQNEQRKAVWYYEQMLNAVKDSGDEELLGLASSLGGRTFSIQGYFGRAVPLLEQAIPYLERIGNWQEWVLTKVSLAISLGGQGHYREGRKHGEEAIQKARELNDLSSIASAIGMTARVEFMAGDLTHMLDETATIDKETERGNPLVYYMILGFQAWAEGRLGMFEIARADMAAADAISARFGTPLIFADWFAAAAAEIALNAGEIERALQVAREAVERAQVAGGAFSEGIAERVWGQALAALNGPDDPEAEAHLKKSLERLAEGEAVIEAARTHVAWGRILRDRGDATTAREHFERAAAQFARSGLERELEPVRSLLASQPPGG